MSNPDLSPSKTQSPDRESTNEPEDASLRGHTSGVRGGQTPRIRTPLIRRTLLLLGPLLVAAAAIYAYLTGGRMVGTDNAYVKADKVPIIAEISGPVAAVMVTENTAVTAGQPLFRIDAAPFRVAVQRAKANLAKTRTDVASLKASYRQKQAELGLAQTNLSFAEREFQRQTELADRRFISPAKLDESRHALEVARQQVLALAQDLARVVESLGGRPETPIEEHPSYREAKAYEAQATLDLDRTLVRAPFNGIVSRLPKPGQYVAAGAPAMSLVGSDRVWIEANFNETDLAHISPGQPVTIEIDTYRERTWQGRVESISPATGAEFSVLPAQNASGNWVKVVQRIPLRIAVATGPSDPPLRAGMSASVEIDTGRRRSLPLFANAAASAAAADSRPQH